MRFFALFLLFAFIASPVSHARNPATDGPPLSHYTLDNGLELIVIPDRRAPVVTHMVWYKAGSADEEPGKSGVAHYLEHVMFKGTQTYPAGEFSALIASVGGDENAFTSYDYTAYHQSIPPDLLERMMQYESDRMHNLILTDEIIETERLVVLEERTSRTDNNPLGLFGEAMSAALYRNHRYGIPIIGWRHEIESLTASDLQAFYDKYYTPNNAIVVVAGDVAAADVIAMAERTYGTVPRRADPGVRARPSEPPSNSARLIRVEHERVRVPRWNRQYLVKSWYNSDDGVALALLGEILGSGATSRIYRELLVENPIATNAGSYYQNGLMDDSTLSFYGTPSEGSSVTDIESAIDSIISDVLTDGVTPSELSRAKNRILNDLLFSLDSQVEMARLFASRFVLGSSLDGIGDWFARVNSIAVSDINAVASHYLTPSRSVTGILAAPSKDN